MLWPWKAKWCKIQETKLASLSTNLLSRWRQISIKLDKINSHSTDFLSRSRHLESSSTKKRRHFQEIKLPSSTKDIWVKLKRSLSLLSTKNVSTSLFVSYQPQMLYHVSTSCLHRTKCQESADWNVAETHDNVAETQRLTCVSGSGYMSFIHVSVAADTTEPDHFSVCFRKETHVSASGFSW